MARKKAGNGYREYKITHLMDGQFAVNVRGIHQGEYFSESAWHVDAKDIRKAMAELIKSDVDKRGVKGPPVG